MSQLKTRISLKHDTEENWLKATNFIPKAGEMIIYDADSTHSAPRLKVGDDKTYVNDLPFANAFTRDFYFKQEFGKFGKQELIPAKGKTMEELLSVAFEESADVSIISHPSISIGNYSSKVVEMGTSFTAKYKLTTSQGKYSNNQTSEVEFNNMKLTGTGNFSDVDITDLEFNTEKDAKTANITTQSTLTFTASHTAEQGDIRDLNGNKMPSDMLIPAVQNKKSEYTITPVLGCFYGFTSEPLDMTTDGVRGLVADKTEVNIADIGTVVKWGEWSGVSSKKDLPTEIEDTKGKWRNFYIAVPDSFNCTELKIQRSGTLELVNNATTYDEVMVNDARNDTKYQNKFRVFSATNVGAYDQVKLILTWK